MPTAPTIPVILDVDTGVDDALAILFAVAHPGIDVLGISCVAGNASLERVLHNTLEGGVAGDAADAQHVDAGVGDGEQNGEGVVNAGVNVEDDRDGGCGGHPFSLVRTHHGWSLSLI